MCVCIYIYTHSRLQDHRLHANHMRWMGTSITQAVISLRQTIMRVFKQLTLLIGLVQGKLSTGNIRKHHPGPRRASAVKERSTSLVDLLLRCGWGSPKSADLGSGTIQDHPRENPSASKLQTFNLRLYRLLKFLAGPCSLKAKPITVPVGQGYRGKSQVWGRFFRVDSVTYI